MNYENLSDDEMDFFTRKLTAVREKIDMSNGESVNDQDFVLPSPKDIFDHFEKHVVGQTRAKKILSTVAHNHYKRLMIYKESGFKKRLDKTNCMLIGPTGSGKTFLVKQLAEFMNVPCYVADANSLTASGYVGKDVDSLIEGLVNNCDGNYDAAGTGIIFIDEFDKIAKRKGAGSTRSGKDVGGESVQQALLKIIEGTIIDYEKTTGFGKIKMQIDTSNILVIVGGAFIDLEEIIGERLKIRPKTNIGIGVDISEREPNLELLHQVTPEDVEEFGFIPEILGRIPLIAVLDELKVEDLVNILSKIKNNQIDQYKELFQFSEKNLEFQDEAIYAIAELAKKQKTGARGLKTIVENVLLDSMFGLEDKLVTKEDVENV